MTRLIEALEALKMRTDLAIIALRRGDRAAAVREIDAAVDDLRDAVDEDLPADENQGRPHSPQERAGDPDHKGA